LRQEARIFRGCATVAAFDAKGERIVTASAGAAHIWDTNTGEPVGKPL
jgi:hypothetical protein